MDEDTLLIPGIVEKVNSKMLSYLYENDDKLVVFFYDPTDRDADDIIDGLEQIDELLDADNVSLVIIDEEDAAEPYGILDLPALVLIQNGIPNFYEEDDLLNHRYVHNVCSIKFHSKHSSNTVLCLLLNLMEQTLFHK